MTKLLCFGDLHLGAGSQYGDRLADARDVLGRIAGLAVEHGVDGILIAGDVFNGPTITPEQLEVFAKFVDACHLVGVPILAITGNGAHDAAVRDTNGLAIFNHIDGINVHSHPGWVEFAGCAVAVLPWVHAGRLIARAGRDVPRDEVNLIAADLLVDVARNLRSTIAAMPISGRFPSILLGHWSVSGAALPAGLPVDQLREPVLPIDALEELGYDHIVMGHIHRPQTLGTTGFYTGSSMPLNHGEASVAHGVAILHVGERQEIDFPGAEYVEIDSPRFVTIDLGSDADVDWMLGNAIANEIAQERLDDAIVRVRFTATSEQMRHIDVVGLRAMLLAAGARSVKVEPQISREQRARVMGVDEQLGEMAALEMWLQAVGYDGDQDALRDRARDLLETIA